MTDEYFRFEFVALIDHPFDIFVYIFVLCNVDAFVTASTQITNDRMIIKLF